MFTRILIISDIEGSSGCWDYRAASFMTPDWARACAAMTSDVGSAVNALFEAGVEHIQIKDFHRTGYNLLPEMLNADLNIIQGYRRGPVPGLGDPGSVQAVMFLGMHAASGTPGFLAHTLTSRLEMLEVNDRPMAEVELFAASLAPFGIRPVFFSGCPVACEQAGAAIHHISLYPIEKSMGAGLFNAGAWRSGLAEAAVRSLSNHRAMPFRPEGTLRTVVKLRAGRAAARKIAARWNLNCSGSQIMFNAPDMHSLYLELIRICYLTPLVEKTLPFCLVAYNLWGRIGLAWVRRKLRDLK